MLPLPRMADGRDVREFWPTGLSLAASCGLDVVCLAVRLRYSNSGGSSRMFEIIVTIAAGILCASIKSPHT